MLGVTFAAKIEGISTPTGTSPNFVMMGAYNDLGFNEIAFTQWMKFGLPVTVTMVIITWSWLTPGITSQSKIELAHPEKWKSAELPTLTIVFGTGKIAVKRMPKEGLILNFLGALVVSGFCYLFMGNWKTSVFVRLGHTKRKHNLTCTIYPAP